jgi:hypothetical protein
LVHDEAPQAPAPAPAAAPAAPAAAAPAEPTLHDFVLNLLRDPSAQQAFDLDPTGCLKAAGLHDLTPADVHDVIPLVTDLVPTDGLNGLGDVTNALAVDGGAGLDGGWATVASHNPLGSLTGTGGVQAGLDGVAAGLHGVSETEFGRFGVGVKGSEADGHIHGEAIVNSPFGTEAGYINVALDEGIPRVGTGAEIAGHTVTLGYDHGLVVEQDLVPVPGQVADLAKGLSDPTAAASALAGAVPALPAVPGLPGLPDLGGLTGGGLPALPALPLDAAHLPALPALPTDQVSHVVDTAQGVVGQATSLTGVGGGADAHAGTDAHAGGLGLPDLLGHLPTLPQLPVDLPHLPVALPHLPVEVPHLPSLPIGDASGHGPVGDLVDHTGLGNVINNNPVTDAVHNVLPDLHLGL